MPKGCKIVNDYEKEEGKKMALNKKPVTGMKDILPAAVSYTHLRAHETSV